MKNIRNPRDARWALSHGYDSDKEIKDRRCGVRSLGKGQRNGTKGSTLRDHRKAARKATKWVQYLCPEEA